MKMIDRSGSAYRKRNWCGLFLTILLALSLTACGGKESNSTSGTDSSRSGSETSDADNMQYSSETSDEDGTQGGSETPDAGSTQDGSETPDAGSAQDGSGAPDEDGTQGGDQYTTHHITIEIEGYGTLSCELYEEAAPETVANFMELAQSGFYDGLTFHRVVPGFVIQGGDPLGNGYGGLENTITGEFAVNGFDNPLSHTRGVLSMARSQDYNSASCQFFIVHQDAQYSLDGMYAAFGCVTEGMEIVDAIVENTPVANPNSGFVEAENQPVITKITVID